VALLLIISFFVIATCGLIYELIAGTLASYLLGDSISITQFSTIIGCYLFAMSIGSWLSDYINRNLLGNFIKIEILVGVVGCSYVGYALRTLLCNACGSLQPCASLMSLIITVRSKAAAQSNAVLPLLSRLLRSTPFSIRIFAMPF